MGCNMKDLLSEAMATIILDFCPEDLDINQVSQDKCNNEECVKCWLDAIKEFRTEKEDFQRELESLECE